MITIDQIKESQVAGNATFEKIAVEEGTIPVMINTDEMYKIISKRYNEFTGLEIEPKTEFVNKTELERELVNNDKQILALQERSQKVRDMIALLEGIKPE